MHLFTQLHLFPLFLLCPANASLPFEVFSLFPFFSFIATTLSLTLYNDNHDDERTNNFMMNDVSFHKAERGPQTA